MSELTADFEEEDVSLFKQPGAVWATGFAAAIAFMGIGLVDPILPSIARGLRASAWQVEMLFTSYIVIMAGAMFVTGAIATRVIFAVTAARLAGMDGNRTHPGRLNSAPQTVLKTAESTSSRSSPCLF